MARVITVNDVLDGHVILDIECLDRIYLNAYVPILQTSSQAVAFSSGHLGFPFPSPVLFRQLGDRFRKAVVSLPLPLGVKDHEAGDWWEVSMRQVEISRTIVFDAPRHAGGFFEALVADNLDIGRPHNVEIIFARKIRRDTKGVFRTAIDRRDNGGVLVNVFYSTRGSSSA